MDDITTPSGARHVSPLETHASTEYLKKKKTLSGDRPEKTLATSRIQLYFYGLA